MSGMMVDAMKAIGRIIKWMEMVYSLGLTEGNMKVNINET